jgi:hypothetical protein
MANFEGLVYPKILKIEEKKYPLVNDCIATKQAIDEINIQIEINLKKALSEKDGFVYSATAKALKVILQRQLENSDLNRCQNLFKSQKIEELSAIISEESKKFETDVSSQTTKANKLVLYIGGGAILLGFIIILVKEK